MPDSPTQWTSGPGPDENSMTKHEEGFSLIDAAIGTVIFGLVAVALLTGLRGALATGIQANVRVTAESIANGQMEAIKAGAYVVAPDGGEGYYTIPLDLPAGYRFATVNASGDNVTDAIYGIPWDFRNDIPWSEREVAPGDPLDPGIQKVTIVVESRNQVHSSGEYVPVFKLVDFKVNR